MSTQAIDIDRLRELHDKATPGPWTRRSNIGRPDIVQIGAYYWQTNSLMTDSQPVSDARFIAEVHEALPALLDELERLRADNGLTGLSRAFRPPAQ
jgi:hypothetical protein